MTKAIDLGVTDVLDIVANVYGMDVNVHGDEAGFLCPVHSERKPSADVNLVSGLWSCFSCGAKGDLAGLGSVVLKKTRDEMIEQLKPGSAEAVISLAQRRLEGARATMASAAVGHVDKRNLHPPSKYKDGPLTYMFKRGFTKETCRTWGIRYVPSAMIIREDEDGDHEFTVTHSIGLPIKNAEGKLQAWAYRATDKSMSWQPRYLYTPKFDLTSNWFGLHRTKPGSDIVIVEGPMDAIWLWQCGFPALALMGSNHKNPKKFRMLERFRSVTILPDYDAGGAFMAENVGSLIRGRVPTRVVTYPKSVIRRTGKENPDPQDLCLTDIQHMMSRAKPWVLWQMRLRQREQGS